MQNPIYCNSCEFYVPKKAPDVLVYLSTLHSPMQTCIDLSSLCKKGLRTPWLSDRAPNRVSGVRLSGLGFEDYALGIAV